MFAAYKSVIAAMDTSCNEFKSAKNAHEQEKKRKEKAAQKATQKRQKVQATKQATEVKAKAKVVASKQASQPSLVGGGKYSSRVFLAARGRRQELAITPDTAGRPRNHQQ